MQDELEKFVHDENIKKFTVLLTVETIDDRREMLTRLLAEETVQLLPAGWSGTRISDQLVIGNVWSRFSSLGIQPTLGCHQFFKVAIAR